ncbi:MAG: hypothetical protein JEZ11_03775 [Desulfobacterales bacterium]|nr:hypothetical protein [Desulfobacterales bacterium]
MLKARIIKVGRGREMPKKLKNCTECGAVLIRNRIEITSDAAEMNREPICLDCLVDGFVAKRAAAVAKAKRFSLRRFFKKAA